MNNIEKKYKKNKSVDPNTFHEIEKNYDNFEKELNDYYYEYDFTLNKLENIYTKAINITKSRDKKKYKFLNGLYLNKDDRIDRINEGIDLCPNLCLGGYMFKIIENIKKINSKSDEKNINNNIYNETIKIFETLINCINSLIKQFNTYKIIIGFLGYNKPDMDILKQNDQKLRLMSKILSLMSENKEVFKKYKIENNKNFLKVTQFSLRKLIEDEDLNINKLVIEYFREYGVCLFKLKEVAKKDGNDCLIY